MLVRPEGLEPPAYWFEVRLLLVRQCPQRSIMFAMPFPAVLIRPLFPPVSGGLAVKTIRELSL